MDNPKSPGIRIESVVLLKASIEMLEPDGASNYNPCLENLSRKISDDKRALAMLMGFDLFHGIKNPRMKFKCTYVVRYSQQGEESIPWDHFSDAMALAHVFPFLREFVANMTGRLPVAPLMLDPINAHSMVSEYKYRNPSPSKHPEI